MPTWAAGFFLLAGLYSFAGGLFDWEWFMTNGKAAVFARWMGRPAARVFYTFLGLLLTALGFAGAFGLI